VDGQVVKFDMDQGANAGESFGFRWSLFKNTLTFTRADDLGLIGPTPFVIKAWTRVK
jgi:hypothetical protein